MSQTRLRFVKTTDAERIAAIYAEYCRSSPATFEIEPPAISQIKARIEKTMNVFPWLVIEEREIVRGYAYAGQHRERAAYRWSADVSVYIENGYQHRGFGKALYTPLLALLTELGFYNAFAGITLPNDGSVGLHRAMGFTAAGIFRNVGFKLNRWHDVQWWHKQLKEPVANSIEPAEPLLLRSLALRECQDRAALVGLLDELSG
ncbi:MAG TPA: arsinothricin resistance N-acetyltransferase ArsN1 family B [Candidatus Obscuribacterales bacterium]